MNFVLDSFTTREVDCPQQIALGADMANPLYFIENDYGRLGVEFDAMDRDRDSRAAIVRLIRSGVVNPVKIIEVIEPCDEYPRGQCLDVTAEIVAEAEQEREPASLDEIGDKLATLLDHARKLRAEAV